MPGVTGVLNQLCLFQSHLHQRRIQPFVERGEGVGSVLVHAANHGHGRVEEVIDSRGFTQKLRIDRQQEIYPGLFSGGLLEDRQQLATHQTGQHRATNDHQVHIILVAQRQADVFTHRLEIAGVEKAAFVAGRSHTNKGNLAIGYRLTGVGGCRNPAGSHPLGQQLAELLFHNG